MATPNLIDLQGNPVGVTNPEPVSTGLLAVPAAPTVTQNASGTGACIQYSIVAVSASGIDTPPSITTQMCNNAVTPNNTISWLAIPGAVAYKILKGGNLLATVSGGGGNAPTVPAGGVTFVSQATLSYTDSAGSTGVAYTANLTSTPATTAVPGTPSGSSVASLVQTATAPGAGAVISTLSGLAAGWYRIEAYAGFGTTGDIGSNLELKIGTTVVGGVAMSAGANGGMVRTVYPRLFVPASTNVTTNAVTAAGAGAIYNSFIIATPTN